MLDEVSSRVMSQAINTEGYCNLGGTIRACHPEKTLAWLYELLPVLGITRIANITGLDNVGIPVTTCIRPNAKHLSVSQGKGLTLVLAEISAIMEAVEVFHAENPPKPALLGDYRNLKEGYPVITPQVFSRTKFIKNNLESMELQWCAALNLLTQETVYIPHILTCLDSTQIQPAYGFLAVSSNGLAAGNTYEEALCHALYEIIERDALCRWRALSNQEQEACQLNNATIDDAVNKELLIRFEQAKLFVKIWEITSALQIPTFHCAIYDSNLFRSLGLFTGTGTHLVKEIALSRALTEAAQARLTLISGNRDDVFPDYYLQQRVLNEAISDQLVNEGSRDYQQCCSVNFVSGFTANIDYMATQLKEHSISAIYVIEHTKPEIDIPVVQAFIPGLQFDGRRM